MKNEYGYYKCIHCGTSKRAWTGSICFMEKTCPKCIDRPREEHDPNHGCSYIGNNMWSCGHIDQQQGE